MNNMSQAYANQILESSIDNYKNVRLNAAHNPGDLQDANILVGAALEIMCFAGQFTTEAVAARRRVKEEIGLGY
jgi:hypothetical protein